MLKASDIMTRDVVTIKGFYTVDQAVRLMRDKKIHTLIVDRRTETDAYGILSDADIVYEVAAYGLDPKSVRVYEIMTKPCISVSPDLGVEYVARLFQQTNIRLAPVIGETLLGVISVTDILQKGDFLEKPKAPLLDEQISAAIQSARATCEKYGASSPQCAAAWDIVEELQAEAAHQRADVLPHTAFDEYCEEYPEALEARMYEV
ncbi:MAG: CP12 domain-containing protein [Prochlorotrichaceae cyanobacterium]|jgi:CBS domain-containing protein